METNKQTDFITKASKEADDKQYYKDQIDRLDNEDSSINYSFGEVSEYKRMKVNYDLFNNVLNLADFEYVCKPFGSQAGELPATMVNRDIVSGKIKAMLGMEMKRPFSWKVIATNPEATTRREEEEFNRIREFVINETMQPIREQIEIKYQQEQGKELNEEEIAQIQQQIAQETKAQTPEQVKKYMQRKYQDPAEVLSHQLLEYLTQKCDLKRKFNDAFKHGMLSGDGVMYVGIFNGEPDVLNVNSLRFKSEQTADNVFIQDREWATYTHKLGPSEIIKYFGDELTDEERDRVYAEWRINNDYENGNLFDMFDRENDVNDTSSISVVHGVWKGLRKIGFLTYLDENGEEQLMLVDENYELNEDVGDIEIEWEVLPEVHETWKIKLNDPIYVKMQPVPGQFKDIDNLHNCKLPYYGVTYDAINSQKTSLMDRLKIYQYYYNIVMYRLELILASDDGKKVLMNINAIPDSAGIGVKQWQYFMKSTGIMWYDPTEEGNMSTDANTVAKVIDLSLISDIQKYIEIAEYLRQQCGRSVGITDSVEGQIGPNESVRNAQQNLTQTSHILELYFDLQAHLKKEVLQALLETAKIAYHNSNKKKLTYVLDDMSRKIINLDMGLLDNSTLGLFISNSAKAQEILDTLKQLSHAALQNQKIELSDVSAVLRQEGVVEVEETLKVAEETRREHEMNLQAQKGEQLKELKKIEEANAEKEHVRELEKIVVKEEERRKTEVMKTAMMGASFNPDQDKDQDGVNDFIELARNGLDAEIKQSQKQLDREKFEHQKEVDKIKLSQQDRKLKNEEKKIKVSSSNNK